MTEKKPGTTEGIVRLFGDQAAVPYVLGDELEEITRVFAANPSVAMARASMRSVFSLLEAFAFSLKVRALQAEERGRVKFSDKELRILHEGELVSQGAKEVRKPYFTGIEENLKSALRLYAKARRVVTPLSDIAPLPANFDHALELRRRLTHPKGVTELALTKDDVASVSALLQWLMKVVSWFGEQETAEVSRISEEIHQSIQSQIAALREGKPGNPERP